MEGSKRQIRCEMRVFANAVMYSYVKNLLFMIQIKPLFYFYNYFSSTIGAL